MHADHVNFAGPCMESTSFSMNTEALAAEDMMGEAFDKHAGSSDRRLDGQRSKLIVMMCNDTARYVGPQRRRRCRTHSVYDIRYTFTEVDE
jgi:hypothetical protein